VPANTAHTATTPANEFGASRRAARDTPTLTCPDEALLQTERGVAVPTVAATPLIPRVKLLNAPHARKDGGTKKRVTTLFGCEKHMAVCGHTPTKSQP
jgi:hypothetical protein